MTIETVNGPVTPGEGLILVHEHLLIDYGELTGEPRTEITQSVIAELTAALSRLAANGVALFVDCTPPHYGRYLDVLRRVSQLSSLPIVASTGSFCEAWAPLPSTVQRASVDELTDWYTRELVEGAGSTMIRAGVIKAATSESMTELEEKTLRAAARAQKRTSAPIVSHTTNGGGMEQLDVYEDEGADLTRVLISHIGFEPDSINYACAIAERGAYLGLDRVGNHHFFDDGHWLELIRGIADRGHVDRILLSHDAVARFFGPSEIAAHTFSDYAYVQDKFLPKLDQLGLQSAEIDLLAERNARRWLFGPLKEDE